MIATFIEAKSDDIPVVDHLSLATMMVYDGKFDKASAELLEAKKYDKNLDISTRNARYADLILSWGGYREYLSLHERYRCHIVLASLRAIYSRSSSPK